MQKKIQIQILVQITIRKILLIVLKKKTGDYVHEGEDIAVLYSNSQSSFEAAEERLLSATEISDAAPEKEPLIYDIIK